MTSYNKMHVQDMYNYSWFEDSWRFTLTKVYVYKLFDTHSSESVNNVTYDAVLVRIVRNICMYASVVLFSKVNKMLYSAYHVENNRQTWCDARKTLLTF